MKPFIAEILFPDSAAVPGATRALAEAGCTLKIDPDTIDDGEPTVFGWILGASLLSPDAIFNWLTDIVEPLGGSVDELTLGLPWHR
jgi:hypothetical protein